jgi:hypothetical protein
MVASPCDASDEITGIPVIWEYTLRPIDICNFLDSAKIVLFVIQRKMKELFVMAGQEGGYRAARLCAGRR